MSIWSVSITELVNLFKGALLALSPWLIRAKIPITIFAAYDDYDEICTLLFQKIVVASLSEALIDYNPLADYGLVRNNYYDRSFISVHREDGDKEQLSLIAFEFENEKQLFLKVATLGSDLNVIDIHQLIPDRVRFGLVRNLGTTTNEIFELKVEI
ncbi:hypothetical protein [Synechococcus sp. PCC 6312]|uniref:hypothetical protein n=1 Tax=Synechococcus sp. (strain ATCC 27167 / PCC 6312) TaxID=195253 RepID=UPI00059CF60B|nr:hypothetical protein [Synechococcus sp. PCC 6312]